MPKGLQVRCVGWKTLAYLFPWEFVFWRYGRGEHRQWGSSASQIGWFYVHAAAGQMHPYYYTTGERPSCKSERKKRMVACQILHIGMQRKVQAEGEMAGLANCGQTIANTKIDVQSSWGPKNIQPVCVIARLKKDRQALIVQYMRHEIYTN